MRRPSSNSRLRPLTAANGTGVGVVRVAVDADVVVTDATSAGQLRRAYRVLRALGGGALRY